MALALHGRPENAVLTVHEGLRYAVAVENSGPDAVELPVAEDESGRLAVVLETADGRRRVMSGLTGQALTSSARLDAEPVLDTLGPGGRWEATIDLAAWHLPLPAGRHRVRATYEHEPAGAALESGPAEIEVRDVPLARLTVARDRAVLDSLVALLEARGPEGPEFYLRQLNAPRPLAAWCSARVLAGEPADEAFVSTSAFDAAETFDPCFERWVVWRAGGTLGARLHALGAPEGEALRATLPPGRAVVPSAVHGADGALRVFLAAPGVLECHRFGPRGLERVFERALPGLEAARAVVRADGQALHVVWAGREVRYARLDAGGGVRDRRSLRAGRLPAHAFDFEPRAGLLRASFLDAPHGSTVTLAALNVDTDDEWRLDLDRVLLRGGVRELAFDVSARGTIHALVAPARGGLYYLRGGSPSRRVAAGPGPFHPHVVAHRRVYLGFARPGLGHRHLQIAGRRARRWLADPETLA